MNAMSIAPPRPMIDVGRPLAYVVVAPVLGSTRVIRPAAVSVTYSARSGPMVLPEPPCRPVTSRYAVAFPEGGVALAADGTTNASSTRSRRTSHPDRRGVPMGSLSEGAVSRSDGERVVLNRPRLKVNTASPHICRHDGL